MSRWAVLLALALCAPTGAQEAHRDAPLPRATETVAQAVTPALVSVRAVIEDVLPATPARPPVDPPVASAAVALIVRWEVTSPAYYTRRLIRPIWPGGASGVTWCVGYDGGHQTAAVILDDWPRHGQRTRLATTAGLTGKSAARVLPLYLDITTPYPECVHVFATRTLIEYERRTARAFRDGYKQLRPNARGALVSLVYNRGAAMGGDHRREMRTLRDECVPAQDYGCIARAIRSMKRLWKNTPNERGLSARREAEAILAETN